MDDRDSEIDDLLSPLQGVHADDLRLKRWQVAVQKELRAALKTSSEPPKSYRQIAAALLVGFLLGGVAVGTVGRLHNHPGNSIDDSINNPNMTQEKTDPNATVEYVFAKSE